MSTSNKILIILGPTSSGKSDIAIKLAKKFNGEIISADSRQIYRGMDVGTGKIEGQFVEVGPQSAAVGGPTSTSGAKKVFISHNIPHYLIDIVSPRTDYNVAKFKKQSEKIIADILRRRKLPVICGGTGFWIKAIVDDVNFPKVKPDWKLRKILEKYSVEKLFAMLKKVDPERAKTIDKKNKVRLIRAIEICKAIGRVPTLSCHSDRAQRAEESTCGGDGYPSANGRRSLDFARDDKNRDSFLQIGLKLSQEKLHANIKKRLQKRFGQGMIAEVKKLHQQGLSWKKIQSFGLAYYWIPLYLQNEISKDELIEKVIQSEKNYAKRQITWFKRDPRIKWLENYKQIEFSVRNFLKNKKTILNISRSW